MGSRITVYYPFHPLHGQELNVVHLPRRNDGAVVVTDPTGVRLKIPLWMALPQAAEYKLSKEIKIKAAALVALSNLLELIQKEQSNNS